MSLFAAQVYPGQALGFLVLGASLHDVLTRLKAEPQRFPKLSLLYEASAPVHEPIILELPTNGVRLRFDGPEQRLRLIEILDFTKSQLTYNNKDVLRPGAAAQASGLHQEKISGPTFRHIYKNLIGPTFPGEYIEPEACDDTDMGVYVLSYPGIAFSFPLHKASWSPGKDVVSLLSSSTSQAAVSMAIFSGESWPDARERLYTQTLDPRESFAAHIKAREPVADEVNVVKIHGEGRLELVRSEGIPTFWIMFGVTTPQEIVAVLGPPDAIYRKNDQRLSIHKAPPVLSGMHGRSENTDKTHDDSTDTDVSSAHTGTDDSDEGEGDGEFVGNLSNECFYNYFYHGFDILVSTPTTPSPMPPSKGATNFKAGSEIPPADISTRLVASKLILHGNVPGSYPFNRHRRCRWEIDYLVPKQSQRAVNSETPFKEIACQLHEEWKSIYENEEEAKARQRGMVLNRDWGDSPGSSVELLGGWEDSVGGKRAGLSETGDTKGLGNTTLYGYPGLVFEVLKSGIVSGLTVF